MSIQDIGKLLTITEKIHLLSRLSLATESDEDLCEGLAIIQTLIFDYASLLKRELEELAARLHHSCTDEEGGHE